jgi:hypothetical protein
MQESRDSEMKNVICSLSQAPLEKLAARFRMSRYYERGWAKQRVSAILYASRRVSPREEAKTVADVSSA